MSNDIFLSASEASRVVSTNKIVLREISLIQEKILDALNNCSGVSGSTNCLSGTYCITVAGDTPMTYFGSLASATVTEAGQDYFPVVATASFTGSGSGATADLIINDAGAITDVTITASGSGYIPNVAEAGVNSWGSVNSWEDDLTNAIIGDAVIVITHPSGVDFVASVQVDVGDGSITSVTITASGTGYGPLLPAITLANAGNGAGAVLTPVVDESLGGILSVAINNAGYSYDTGTTATVVAADTSSGADATVTVTVTQPPLVSVDPLNYYSYLNDQATSCPVEKDIQSVVSYFRKKGYTIEPLINQTTNSTIQWKICWC
jgi:hypothetical protein